MHLHTSHVWGRGACGGLLKVFGLLLLSLRLIVTLGGLDTGHFDVGHCGDGCRNVECDGVANEGESVCRFCVCLQSTISSDDGEERRSAEAPRCE